MTDLGLLLLRHGYGAIARDREARRGAGTYVSRLLGRRTVVVSGESGARAFYDDELVRRSDAVPPPLAGLLFGRGAVHGLDGDEHRTRKDLFLGQLGPGRVVSCAREAGRRLTDLLDASAGREVDLHDALVTSYGGAVLGWVGLRPSTDVHEQMAAWLSREYAAIVDGFGFAGPSYPRAWLARLRTDRWATAVVDDVRTGRLVVEPACPLSVLAASGLDERTAGVELGNLIRPTVAVSWLGEFAAVALAGAGEQRAVLAAPGAERERWAFAQEVRRTAPFVPALAGRARRDAEVDGIEVREGDRLVLDVRGINLDPATYPEPERFHGRRFLECDPGPFDLVPQGGGMPTGHRCPGESMTMAVLVETVRALAVEAVGPVGPVGTDERRIPTRPGGGVRVRAGAQPAG